MKLIKFPSTFLINCNFVENIACLQHSFTEELFLTLLRTTLSPVIQKLHHLNKESFTVNNDCVYYQYFHLEDFYKG